MGWKGAPAVYGAIQAGVAGGGGNAPDAGDSDVAPGLGGAGGPGPGAFIGLPGH